MTLDRRRFARSLAAAAALPWGVQACSRAAAADQLTVLLDWFVNPNHGPLIVAQQIGAFRRAGLQVAFVQPADPTMPPRLVAADHGDVAIDYQPSLYLQVASGLPLARIGVLVNQPMVSYATLQGFGVTRAADLKGKRVGYNDVMGPVGLAEIDALLASGGLRRNDVQLVNVGTALSTSLLTHRVDLVGVERNFELFELKERGGRPIAFDVESFGVPAFDNLIMVVNRRKAHDPRFPRFVHAVGEGAAYVKARPDDAWRLFIGAYPNLNNSLNRQAWDCTVPCFAANPAEFDAAKYDRFGRFLLARGVIPSLPPPSAYAVQIS